MSKPRKRRQPRCKGTAANDGDLQSSWTIESTLVGHVRLRPVAPALWRETLLQLRSDFLAVRVQQGALRCPLFQNTASRSDEQSTPFGIPRDHVAFRGGVYHGFRQFVGRDGRPLYLKYPIVDVDGQPIVDSDGRGIRCAMPALRQWSYGGTSEASARFVALAERGGLALLGSPQAAISWIPRETLLTCNDEHRWVWSAFDLAWMERHPSLRAERRTWFHPRMPNSDVNTKPVYAPYDLKQLRSLHKCTSSWLFSFPEEWTERLPGYFISELPDMFQASADLIDVLFDLVAQAEGEAQVPPKNGSATVSEPSPNASNWNALTDRQRNCLRALRESKAHNADSRRRASDVAVKVEGFAANVNGFKEPLSDLVLRGLVNSKTGAGGGYWLTELGCELLAEFDPDRSSGSQPS